MEKVTPLLVRWSRVGIQKDAYLQDRTRYPNRGHVFGWRRVKSGRLFEVKKWHATLSMASDSCPPRARIPRMEHAAQVPDLNINMSVREDEFTLVYFR
jgi:hypothetical protein